MYPLLGEKVDTRGWFVEPLGHGLESLMVPRFLDETMGKLMGLFLMYTQFELKNKHMICSVFISSSFFDPPQSFLFWSQNVNIVKTKLGAFPIKKIYIFVIRRDLCMWRLWFPSYGLIFEYSQRKPMNLHFIHGKGYLHLLIILLQLWVISIMWIAFLPIKNLRKKACNKLNQ
jgi:hypothetical protein